MLNTSIYIHFPFCAHRCHYCAFFTLTDLEKQIPQYCSALKQELTLYLPELKDRTITSIYLGGGTPSLVPPELIHDVLQFFYQHLTISHNCEITLEANPESVTAEKLSNYFKAGINRLSFGLQAWQNRLLEKIGRNHTQAQFLKAFSLAQSAGFSNINVDLIFGLPSQTESEWLESLEAVSALKPAHMACYSLELDNSSYFGRQVRQGKLRPMADSRDRHMSHQAHQRLTELGYHHYEISNFALPGKECQHNVSFWNGGEYLGFGAGAASFFNQTHFQNPSSLPLYLAKLAQGKPRIIDNTEIDSEQLFIMLQLRLVDGLSFKKYHQQFHKQFDQEYRQEIDTLLNLKLVTSTTDSLLLTEKGRDLIDTVTAALFKP